MLVKSYRVNYHKNYIINDHDTNDYDLRSIKIYQKNKCPNIFQKVL